MDAALVLTSILLSCCAFLFAAAGVAVWLSQAMPIHFALLTVAGLIALFAILIFVVGHQLNRHSEGEAEKRVDHRKSSSGGLTSIAKTLTSSGAPLDIMASGLFARQMKKHPIATIAATAAVGALLAMMADAAEDAID